MLSEWTSYISECSNVSNGLEIQVKGYYVGLHADTDGMQAAGCLYEQGRGAETWRSCRRPWAFSTPFSMRGAIISSILIPMMPAKRRCQNNLTKNSCVRLGFDSFHHERFFRAWSPWNCQLSFLVYTRLQQGGIYGDCWQYKKQMLSDSRYDGLFLSASDGICFRLVMNGQYTICKMSAVLRAELKKIRKSRLEIR